MEPTHEASEPPIELSQDDKTMAMVAHLSTFVGYMMPLGNIIGPLVIYLIKKDQSPFIRENATEALNFQISLLIYAVISLILVFFIIGIFLLFAIMILDVVCTICAAIKASDGETYRYPMTIRFVRNAG